ncbi:MAG: hypothetical protein KBS43_00930 [Oscillospiraceae bacterium]|nr:hypothetical protein [Candidatus Limimonas coprohippi]
MKNKKILAIVIIALLGMFVLTACAYDAQLFANVDFANSPFKHITNGGKGGDDPYNISAITGATLTVEGPGMKSSVPLSTKELENQNDGLARGVYKDKNGRFAYEGIDVYYLLNKMADGDNGIVMTDTAYKVVFKNSNRETIAELTLKDIEKAHKDGQPVLITYGMGSEDGKTTVAPFVFSGANPGEHTKGYVEKLNNEDGCLKLVYNFTKYGKNKSYKEFSNCAYLYVVEETTPGFKHSKESGDVYANENLKNYVIAISGKTLGYEVDFTVEQLEALVKYNKDGSIKDGGLGYKDYYSLANNTYWYVNEYEGLDLYKLLQYVGMPSAEELGDKAAKTDVIFSASDGYTSAEKFSVAQLSDYNNFGYYKKNSADLDDGTYVSTNADLVKTGYPVMLAYGVNSYPYTITNGDEGFISGLSNNGGPMRIIFGKTEYGHPNGSNQIQYVSNIIVGANYALTSHYGSRDEDQQELVDNEFKVVVNNVDGSKLADDKYTVKDFEDLIYGEDATSNQVKAAKVKGLFGGDVYEGVDLDYYLSNIIGIPGTNGTVTFSNGKDKVKVELTDLFGQKGFIAYAKNGTPLVETEKSAGYVASRTLKAISDEPTEYKVDNAGGPLMLVIPDKEDGASKAQFLTNITSITVNVEPDQYAHLSGDAAKLAENKIVFTGEGVNAETTYTVADLEGMQKVAVTVDFGKERFRGIPIYDLLISTGIRYNTNEVIFVTTDGKKETFKLGDLRGEEGKPTPLLAFGKGDVSKALKEGAPLAETEGPLMLVTADKQIKSVVKVELTTIEMASWDHTASDLYTGFLDEIFTVTIKSGSTERSYDYTLKELEGLSNLVERTDYSVLDLGTCEGINLWGLVKYSAGADFNLSNPVSVNGYASDGYSKDLLAIFGLEALDKGVVDGNGQRKPIIICYAINGYPLVFDENDEGYTGLVANSDGPMRFVTETNQGASVKHANKIVVTLD